MLAVLARLFERPPQPEVRRADPREVFPSLLEVVDVLGTTRSDPFADLDLSEKRRATLLIVSSVLMTIGLGGVAVILVLSLILFGDQPLWLWVSPAFSVLAAVGLMAFGAVCSDRSFARIDRLIRIATTVGRRVSCLASLGLSLAIFAAAWVLTAEPQAVLDDPSAVWILTAGQLFVVGFALIALSATPPLLAFGRGRLLTWDTQAPIAAWYLSLAVLVVMCVVSASAFSGDVALPAAVVVALGTWLVLRIESRRLAANDAARVMLERLTGLVLAADRASRDDADEAVRDDFERALLDVQDSWTEDRVRGLAARRRVDLEFVRILAYLVARVADRPGAPVPVGRERFFAERLGDATPQDLAALTVDFADKLRSRLARS